MLRTGILLCLKTAVGGFAKPQIVSLIRKENFLLNMQSIRSTSFFNRLTQEQLWKGVVSVSNAGRKRGRGRGGDTRYRKDLNVGKKIGEGKIRVSWPGLTSPVFKDENPSEIKELPQKKSEAPEVPREIKSRVRRKLHPLERGWSGKKPQGRKIGPPPPTGSETFEDFQSVVLQYKTSVQMTATLGRKRKLFCIVATGNGNGLIGLGSAKATDGQAAIKLAKKRSSKRLFNIDLIDVNTVNHDFFSHYGTTRITVLKKPEGYGLKTHRIIRALCQLIGIKDLYAKVEGAINPKHIIRAFLVGLLRQKTYQEIADERKLHLVEFRKEHYNFPRVLASPEQCLTPAEARKDNLSFHEYIMGGRHIFEREPKVPFYRKLPGWTTYLKRSSFARNHGKVKIDLLVKYGLYQSHLTKIYPECIGHYTTPKKTEAVEQ